MSAWDVYQNRGVRALLVAFPVLLILLGFLKPFIGIGGWSIGFVSLVATSVALMLWQVRRTFPAGGIGATDEKVVPMGASFSRTYEAATEAVKDCGWKLLETNPQAGTLKAKIGRTINTLYGQLFIVSVKRVDERSSELNAKCSTLYQILDYGRNNKMIEKFRSRLHQRLSSS